MLRGLETLEHPYVYRIKNIRVVDGDTVDCDIDFGFDRDWETFNGTFITSYVP